MRFVVYPFVYCFGCLLRFCEIKVFYLRAEIFAQILFVIRVERHIFVRPERIRQLENVLVFVIIVIFLVVEVLGVLQIFRGERGEIVVAEIRVQSGFGASRRARLQHSQTHIQRQRTEHRLVVVLVHRIENADGIQHVVARYFDRCECLVLYCSPALHGLRGL